MNITLKKYVDYEFQHSNNHYCLAIFVFENNPNSHIEYYVDIWSSKVPIPNLNSISKTKPLKFWVSEYSNIKFYRDNEANKRKSFFIDFIKDDILKNFTESEILKIKIQLQNENIHISKVPKQIINF